MAESSTGTITVQQMAEDLYEAAMGAADDFIVNGAFRCDHEYAEALAGAGRRLIEAAGHVESKGSRLFCDYPEHA